MRHYTYGADTPFRYVCDEPFEHDVQRRAPSVTKAKEILGFEATTTLDELLDDVVPWIVSVIEGGLISRSPAQIATRHAPPSP